MPVGAGMWPAAATAGQLPPSPNALTVDFTISPTQSAPGDSVTFSGTASGGTPPYIFNWTFGDGGVATGTGSQHSVPHTYSSAGNFTVNLTVTDLTPLQIGTKSKSIVVAPLVADFSVSPTNPVAGQTVAFSGNATGGSPPYSFRWMFGDGSPAGSGQNLGHAFASPGTFTVTLTVTDSASPPPNEASRPRTVTVSPAPLVADFSFSPRSPVVGQSITFSANASGGTQLYTYSWTFGDGTPTGNGPTVNHMYGSPGNFTTTLTVSDSGSPKQVVTATKIVNVMGADFTFSPTNPLANQPVTFSASVTGGTPAYTFSWTFGDGTNGAGQRVTHTYASVGNYTVTLTVRDSVARIVIVSKLINVASVAASFTSSPAKPMVGEVVVFNATASGGTPPYTYSWTFGDGTPTGNGPTVNHVYGFPGTFAVFLTVTDFFGRPGTASKQIPVTPALDGDITVSQAKPMIGETVNFTATAAGGTPPYGFSWTFGDGGMAIGRNTTHAYATAGTFTVTLRVTDFVGHIHNSTLQLPVSPRLVANFTRTPLDPVASEEVFFTATVTGGTSPYEYLWAWGDGTPNGIGSGPAHRFATAGPFRVVLTVFDSANHRTNVTKTVIVNPALATNMTVSLVHPAVGEQVRFSANASGGSTPYTFRWEFGDGANATGPSVLHVYARDGTFDVEVTARDVSGRRGVRVQPLVVTPRLTVNFSPPRNASAGERVNFAAEIDGGTAPYKVTWAFGDGITRVGPLANHTYGVAGTYNVTLAASDSANHTATVSKLVVVGGALAARAAFSPPMPIVGERITFIGNASGGTPPYTYGWSFGDGTRGSGLTVTHFYVNATRFNVTLNITDALGRFAVATLVVVVNPTLAVTFRYDPSMPIPGRPITYTPIVSGGNPPYTYSWTLGDPGGTTSAEERPTHTYFSSDLFATYRVSLEVCDSAGHCVTATRDVTLVDWPQVATIGVAVAIASVLVLWFVRRFRGQQSKVVRAAGRTALKQATRLTQGVAGRVRDVRNGRLR